MSRPNNGPYLGAKRNAHGQWQIHWTDDGRSRVRSTGTGNLGEARQVLADFIVGFGARQKKVAKLTVARMLADYWNEHVLLKVVARDTQFYNIKHLAEHFACYKDASATVKEAQTFIDALAVHAGGLLASEVDRETGAAYDAKRRTGKIGRPSGDATIRRELSCLTAAAGHAAERKRLTADEAPAVEMPPKPPARDRWMADAERDALLAACQLADAKRLTRVYRFVALAFGTAARRGALRELTWFQVKLDEGLIYLNPHGRQQTKKRRPTVPIASWLRPILQRAWEERTSEYVLDHPGSVRTAFDSACERAGLAAVTPHVIRHTWATRAMQEGIPPWKIAQVLGDTLATVMATYAHHCPEHLRDAVEWGAPETPEREDVG